VQEITKKIIVADDTDTLRELYKRAFESINVVPTVCPDGQVCLDQLRNAHYDILFLDLIMPHVDGETVLRTVREEFPKLQVVIASVQDDEAAIQELLDLGAKAYLVKPFTVEQLVDIVRRLSEVEVGR